MGRGHRNSGRGRAAFEVAPAEDMAGRSLVVVGAGPPLAEVLDLLHDYPEYRPVGILDPARALWGQALKGLPVLGWLPQVPDSVGVAAIGNPAEPEGFDRGAVFHILIRRGIQLPILKAAGSRSAPDVTLPRATVLLPRSDVQAGAKLGENCLIGPGVVIESLATLPPHAVVLAGDSSDAGPGGRRPAIQPRSLDATLAPPDEPIRHVIRRINWANMEIVLIVDNAGILIGTVTDGDIRRGILAGIDSAEPVSEIMNRRPVTAELGASRDELLEVMRCRCIRHLPIVDTQGRPIRLERMEDLAADLARPCAVVMAGGMGTRLRPLTERTPKPLLHVKGRPILDHVLAGLRDSGIDEVVISLNYLGGQIRRHVADGAAHGLQARYVEEKQRLGTAGALSLLRPRPRRPFVVMNGDLLTGVDFSRLLAFREERDYDMVICVRKHETRLPYGVVQVHDGAVIGIREKPCLEHFINAGMYVLKPACLDAIPAGRFFDMPDLVARVLDGGGAVGAFPVHEYWRDIGTPADLAAVAEEKEATNGGNRKRESGEVAPVTLGR